MRVKNWERFQHYRNRRPPWIKLHRDLLDNRQFACLPLASKALAPCIWLLASESDDGTVNVATEELVFRLRFTAEEVEQGLKPLIDNGLLVECKRDASKVRARRSQVATSETEGEGETKSDSGAGVIAKSLVKPEVWSAWLAERRPTRRAIALQEKRLAAWAQVGMDPTEIVERSLANGWKGLFPLDVVAKTSPAPAAGIPEDAI